jgi:hypothetical protein
MKIIPLAVLSLLVAACATAEKPGYLYNEIRVQNNSKQMLRDFRITVPSTGAEFRCGNIAPLGLCSNRIRSRPYRQNPIVIEWSYGNRQRQTSEFVVPVPANYAIDAPIQGVVEVSAGGGMQVYFLQEAGAY